MSARRPSVPKPSDIWSSPRICTVTLEVCSTAPNRQEIAKVHKAKLLKGHGKALVVHWRTGMHNARPPVYNPRRFIPSLWITRL